MLALAMAACAGPKPLPVMGEVPQFELILQTGEPFDRPCPMMSHQMRGLQGSTESTPEVKLVSFSVDPAHDTPPVLAKYAQLFKADTSRWFFLTGDMARLNELGLKGFKLNTVDGSLSHSTRFALVDGRRRIRGFYLTSDDDFKTRLLHDLHQLEREKS
jgi:protein SCO1/2